MKLSCLFGHKWDGCTCARCGEVRDEGHEFKQFSSNGALCVARCKCGKSQTQKHDLRRVPGKCFDVCARCGFEAAYNPHHAFERIPGQCGWKCRVCGKIKPFELSEHSWQRVEGQCAEKCAVCGLERKLEHQWRRVEGKCARVCDRCGMEEAFKHQWKRVEGTDQERCAVCGETRQKPKMDFSAYTVKRLNDIRKRQPTWFWIDEDDGSTRCQSLERCEGNRADAGFHPCHCAKCGYAVHLELQPDFTCNACEEKVSALDAVNTVSAYVDKAVYNRALWPGTIRLSAGLPALLAASIGPDGTDMAACERAHDCFCINLAFRERWEAMQASGKLSPGQVESLFTAMILHFMEVYQKKQPERNLFA